MVVENRKFGNRAYCAINEGLGKVMRFGGNDAEVLARLRLAARRVRAGARRGAARPRRRAAEGRSSRAASRWATRCTSATSPAPACSCARSRRRWRAPPTDSAKLAEALAFIARQRPVLPQHRDGDGQGDDRSGARHRGSTVVTAMCRNGTDFGIRVSRHRRPLVHRAGRNAGGALLSRATRASRRQSRHGRLAPSSRPSGSAVSRWARRPPSSASSAPGSAVARPRDFTRAMREITVGENPEWTIPAMDYRRRADRHRCAARGRDRHRADDQHRHRAPPARHRPGRRRRRAGADGVLRAGGRRRSPKMGVS